MSFDTPEENRAFREKFDLNFALLCDTDRSLGMAYGACDSPSDGYARRIGVVIDEQGLIEEYEANVDAASYPREVLARIRS